MGISQYRLMRYSELQNAATQNMILTPTGDDQWRWDPPYSIVVHYYQWIHRLYWAKDMLQALTIATMYDQQLHKSITQENIFLVAIMPTGAFQFLPYLPK